MRGYIILFAIFSSKKSWTSCVVNMWISRRLLFWSSSCLFEDAIKIIDNTQPKGKAAKGYRNPKVVLILYYTQPHRNTWWAHNDLRFHQGNYRTLATLDKISNSKLNPWPDQNKEVIQHFYYFTFFYLYWLFRTGGSLLHYTKRKSQNGGPCIYAIIAFCWIHLTLVGLNRAC